MRFPRTSYISEFDRGAFTLFIESPRKITSQEKFEAALLKRQKHHANYYFELVLHDGDKPIPYKYPDRVVIKTERAFATGLAKSSPKDGNGTAGASLTHHMNTANAKDISTVLNEVKD